MTARLFARGARAGPPGRGGRAARARARATGAPGDALGVVGRDGHALLAVLQDLGPVVAVHPAPRLDFLPFSGGPNWQRRTLCGEGREGRRRRRSPGGSRGGGETATRTKEVAPPLPSPPDEGVVRLGANWRCQFGLTGLELQLNSNPAGGRREKRGGGGGGGEAGTAGTHGGPAGSPGGSTTPEARRSPAASTLGHPTHRRGPGVLRESKRGGGPTGGRGGPLPFHPAPRGPPLAPHPSPAAPNPSGQGPECV